MISDHFQGKPFSIMVIQIYVSSTNAEEAEVEQFYEDLQDFLELTPKKDVLYIIGSEWSHSVVSDSLRPHESQHASCPSLFATSWIVACLLSSTASLSITNSRSSLRLMSIESVMPSSHLILCCPLFFLPPPASESFPMSQLFAWGGQSTGFSFSIIPCKKMWT